jgi:hypothetical protein
MLMRFHWGLGVGHVYTHQHLCTNQAVVWRKSNSDSSQSCPLRNDGPESSDQMGMGEGVIDSSMGTDNSGSESDDSDYKLSEGDDESSDGDDDDDDDEHLMGVDEMYGLFNSDDELSD